MNGRGRGTNYLRNACTHLSEQYFVLPRKLHRVAYAQRNIDSPRSDQATENLATVNALPSPILFSPSLIEFKWLTTNHNWASNPQIPMAIGRRQSHGCLEHKMRNGEADGLYPCELLNIVYSTYLLLHFVVQNHDWSRDLATRTTGTVLYYKTEGQIGRENAPLAWSEPYQNPTGANSDRDALEPNAGRAPEVSSV
jgi:hypothetical protein